MRRAAAGILFGNRAALEFVALAQIPSQRWPVDILLEAKYFVCAEGSLSPQAAAALRDTILDVEKLADIAKLMDSVR